MERRREILKYLTPNTPAAELDRVKRSFCIPNDAEWLGVFMGAIYPLTRPESWELHGSVTPEEAAEVFQSIFDDAFYGVSGDCEMECCPVRIGSNGVLQQSSDGGETWEDAPLPPVPARTPIEGQDTKCLAAANATEVMLQLWDAFANYYINGATLMIAISGIITIIALLWFFPPAVPLVFTFFYELWGLMSEIGADDFDSDKQDIFRCILYCNSTLAGGVVTFDINDVISEVDVLVNGEINIWVAIRYLLDIIGEDGLNRAGTTTSITSADCGDCTDCPPEWCYTFDFTANNGGWGIVLGRYVAATGYASRVGAPGSDNLEIETPAMTGTNNMTSVQFFFNGEWNGTNPHITVYDGGSTVYGVSTDFLSSTITVETSGASSLSVFRVNLDRNTGDIPTQEFFDGLFLTRITVRGTGTNPFGADNCS